MSDKTYRINVDFDNTIVPFLYNTTGQFTFTVPAIPNFPALSPTRYVVYLPCVMVLNDDSKIPAIATWTRVETTPAAYPGVKEWRTIPKLNYDAFLLKNAIEFHSGAAGQTLTITNLWTVGSTVDPDIMVNTVGDQTILGIKTFGSIPVAPASNPTTDNQLTRKKYVDDTVLASRLWINPARSSSYLRASIVVTAGTTQYFELLKSALVTLSPVNSSPFILEMWPTSIMIVMQTNQSSAGIISGILPAGKYSLRQVTSGSSTAWITSITDNDVSTIYTVSTTTW